MKGIIKWYNGLRGFGFIGGEDGNDVFVHRTALPLGTDLSEGDHVEYEIEESDRGPRAIKVKTVTSA